MGFSSTRIYSSVAGEMPAATVHMQPQGTVIGGTNPGSPTLQIHAEVSRTGTVQEWLDGAGAVVASVDTQGMGTFGTAQAWGDSHGSTRFGESALQNNTGIHVAGFGYMALQNNTGMQASGFGNSALQNNKGRSSAGFGYMALQNNTGNSVSGFGNSALQNNTDHSASGFGISALSDNRGNHASGFGAFVLSNNAGDGASGFGYSALFSNTGGYVTGVGYYAVEANAGARVTALGAYAQRSGPLDTAAAKTFNATDIENNVLVTITGHGFGAAGTQFGGNLTGSGAVGARPNASMWEVIDANTIKRVDRSFNAGSTGTYTITPYAKADDIISIGAHASVTGAGGIAIGSGDKASSATAAANEIQIGGNTKTFTLGIGQGDTTWKSTADAPVVKFQGSPARTGSVVEVLDAADAVVASVDTQGMGTFGTAQALGEANGATRFGANALKNSTGMATAGFGPGALRNNKGHFRRGSATKRWRTTRPTRRRGSATARWRTTRAPKRRGSATHDDNNTGTQASGFGGNALYSNKGLRASGFGYKALHDNTHDDAVAVGAFTTVTGAKGIAIGSGSDAANSASAGANEIQIGANLTTYTKVGVGDDRLIPLAELKTLVAAASDFDSLKTAVAALA